MVKITQNGIDTIQDNSVSTQKIADNGITHDDLPSGSNLQIAFNNSNNNWGTIGNNSVADLSQADVTITTRGNNSKFIVHQQVSTNDTNSTNFGTGVGLKIIVNSVTTELLQPAKHEDYTSGGYDTYKVARNTTEYELNYPKGTAITFRMTTRFNNSNGICFQGNGLPYYTTRQIIQEIKS
jgi:hypothetical protein